MKRVNRVANIVCEATGHLGWWLVVLMVPFIIIEVIMRYAFRRPLGIADEFSAYMLVALAFIGLAYTWREKGHIRLDIVVSRLPVKVSSWLRVITLLVGLAYSIMLSVESYGFVAVSFERNMRSSTWLMTPLQGPHLTVSIGCTILSLFLLVENVRAIRALKTKASVGEDAL